MHGSRSGEGAHPVRNDFGSLIRREIGEGMAQFQPKFDYICHAALAQFAQEHQAREEPLLCHKVRLAALSHIILSALSIHASTATLASIV
jgi:hypothetical protein